jgi:uncharacterized phage protein (TIGR01671 family)
MREIKFRGQRIHNNEWVYGSLLQSEIDVNQIAVKCAIAKRFADSYNINTVEIKPETAGEYTGLKDKNGKEIYEGDILNAKYAGGNDTNFKNKVVWKDEECGFSFANCPMWAWEDIEVIGNIYEHPELIKTTNVPAPN